MSDEQKVQLTVYAKRKYNALGEVPLSIAANYFRALLIIAGSDDKLSREELSWFIDEHKMLGFPVEQIEDLDQFDWQNTDLETLLHSLKYDFDLNVRRILLYQSIKMIISDSSFHEKERTAVEKTAKLLNIDEETLHSLEALVEMENSLDKLRFNLLGTRNNQAKTDENPPASS